MKQKGKNEKKPLVTNINEAKYILHQVNWNFSTPFSIGRSGFKLFDCRKYHWFPATFIPEIPYTLIEILSKPGAVVYDPFAGIGTTLYQALILGRNPLGTEIGKVPSEIIKVMCSLFNPNVNLSQISEVLEQAVNNYDPESNYENHVNDKLISIDRLKPWFNPKTFNEILYLVMLEQELINSPIKGAVKIALSSTLKTVCGQDRGWGCIADNMLPKDNQLSKKRDAIEHFRRKLRTLKYEFDLIREALPKDAVAYLSQTDVKDIIHNCDIRECNLPSNSTDLIITSPPYPDMADYSTSQRLSCYLFNSDPMDTVTNEIGARRKRFKSTSIQDYINDMKEALTVITSIVKIGGYACFVMPRFSSDKLNNSTRKIAVQECMGSLATNFILELELVRALPTRRRHHNQKWATLEEECIHVYRRLL